MSVERWNHKFGSIIQTSNNLLSAENLDECYGLKNARKLNIFIILFPFKVCTNIVWFSVAILVSLG